MARVGIVSGTGIGAGAKIWAGAGAGIGAGTQQTVKVTVTLPLATLRFSIACTLLVHVVEYLSGCGQYC